MSENLIKQFHCDWPYCGTTADQPATFGYHQYSIGQELESDVPADWTIYDGKWYCPLHKRTFAEGKKHNWPTGNTTDRGYGYRWQQVRRRVLVRDKHQCRACKRKGIYVPAGEVDHIVPKSQGGSDDLSNLESLCRTCHQVKTQGESRPHG